MRISNKYITFTIFFFLVLLILIIIKINYFFAIGFRSNYTNENTILHLIFKILSAYKSGLYDLMIIE